MFHLYKKYRRTGLISVLIILCISLTGHEYKKAKSLESNKDNQQQYLEDAFNRNYNRVESNASRPELVIEKIKPKSVIRIADGHYFIEFERAAFGTIQIEFRNAQIENNVQIILGEKKDGNHIWRILDRKTEFGKNIGYFKTQFRTRSPNDIVTIQVPERFRPDKKDITAALNSVLPFRYCEIIGAKNNIGKDNIHQLMVHYPFHDNFSYFHSDNSILNEVYEFCKYTIKATSYCGIYVDGNRERKPYEADAYINQLGHYSVDSEYDLARYTQRYLFENTMWPTEWIMHSIFMAYADFMYTGNKDFLKEIYPKLKSRTLYMLARDDGLIRTDVQTPAFLASINRNVELIDLVDVPESERDDYDCKRKEKGYFKKTIISALKQLRGNFVKILGFDYAAYLYKEDASRVARSRYKMPSVNTVVNSFHYAALRHMGILANYLGKSNDQQFFENQAEKVKKSIQKKLFNTNRGLFVDGEGSSHSSLHANMFPLAFGLVPIQHEKKIIDFIKNKGMACSPYGAQYLLEGLYSAGEDDYALSLLTSRGPRSWAHMIYDVGSTITTESWDNSINPTMDWNHAWGSAPVNIISRYVMGIRPVEPGFKRFVIKPLPGTLKFAEILIPSLNGFIKVQYRNEKDQSISLTVAIPVGSEAEVFPPAIKGNWSYNRILVDGSRVNHPAKDKPIHLSSGKHFIQAIQ
jgi:hypothetical protein